MSVACWHSTTDGASCSPSRLVESDRKDVRRYADAADKFRSALEIAQVTQTSQASWATTWLNLGTSLRKLGRLAEARDAYVKVLEIDSRSAPALGFLGLVYHLMDRLDDAIVKYHEVGTVRPNSSPTFLRRLPIIPFWAMTGAGADSAGASGV
jgi:tetratricopeptide (TPR) repeat protein